MKKFYLFVMAFAVASFSLIAQDTVRVSIGTVEVNDSNTEIEVPIFADLPPVISSFQFAIEYDSTVMRFDTLTFSESLPSNIGATYNLIEEGNLRLLFITMPIAPIVIGDDGRLLTLNFSVNLKEQGIYPISFSNDFRTVFVNTSGDVVPNTTTDGAVIFQSLVQIDLTDSIVTSGVQETCLPLIGDFFPTVSSFRFIYNWNPEDFDLTDIRLGANPLSLDAAAFTQTPGQLIILRTGSLTDTIARLPIFTKLLELCFTNQRESVGSTINLLQDSAYYLVPGAEALRRIPILRDTGRLAYRPDLNGTSVEITFASVQAPENQDSVCVPVIINQFNEIGDFNVDFRYFPQGPSFEAVVASSIANVHPQLLQSALTLTTPANGFMVGINYSPRVPRAISLTAGDTLLEVCFQIMTACSATSITENRSFPETYFNLFDRSSGARQLVPYRINSGRIAPYIGSASIGLDTVITTSVANTVTLQLNGYTPTVPLYGVIAFDYPLDSLTLVSATVNTSLINAGAMLFPSADGGVLNIGPLPATSDDLWPAGKWFTLTFLKNFEEGDVRVGMSTFSGSELSVAVCDSRVNIPSSISDGRIITKNTVAVSESAAIEASLYPNPVLPNSSITINAEALAGTTADLRLLDITGRQIIRSTVRFNGSGAATYLIPKVPTGTYVVRITAGGGEVFQQILLVR